MYETVEKLAGELRLYGIYNCAQRRCAQSEAEQLHPSELIKLLLEDEKHQRRELTAKRLKTKAKFRSSAALEEWDFNHKRGISKAKLKELMLLNFYHKKQNLIIVGKTGVGKTHLAIALGERLCQETLQTKFYSTNLFFEEARSQKAAGGYLNFLKQLKRTKALILDDFALRKYSHDEANILLEVLEERYQNSITIITSQVSPQGWRALFDDSVITEAICDRMEHPSEIVELKGESYRQKLKDIDPEQKMH